MSDENMTGSILIAHPTLRDPNFRRTTLFLSHHSRDEGAMGLILNRPLGENLPELPGTPTIPIFYGGPVEPGNILLASLQWRDNPTVIAFRTFAGKTSQLIIEPEWQGGLRAFAGYAGWSPGQLENEIANNSWIVTPPTRELIQMNNPKCCWKETLRSLGPMMHLLAEAPDEPWNN